MKTFIQKEGCLFYILLFAIISLPVGYLLHHYWLSTIAVLILPIFTGPIYQAYKFHRKLHKWLNIHEGEIILFYLSTKERQQLIEEFITPELPTTYLKVFYDGPKIAGDIPPGIVIELMRTFCLSPHETIIMRIYNKSLLQENISEQVNVYAQGLISQSALIKEVKDKLAKLLT